MPSAWDPVPWMIGGGALHSVNVGRNVAYAAFGGSEGIVDATSCEVRELASPGSQIRVYPGTVAILNRAAGVLNEMYAGRNPAVHTIDIPATTSASVRSDLIVARVENPYDEQSGWSAPSDPTKGPYIFTRRIENVPATTTRASDLGLGHSMIALARIDLPKSTTNVTQAMITDLRQLTRQQQQREGRVVTPSELEANSKLTSTTPVNWIPSASIQVPVPTWATHCRLLSIFSGFAIGEGGTAVYNCYGNLTTRLGSGGTYVESAATGYDLDVPAGAGISRTTMVVGGEKLAIPAALRGTTVTLSVWGTRTSGTSSLRNRAGTVVAHQVDFYNLPTANV